MQVKQFVVLLTDETLLFTTVMWDTVLDVILRLVQHVIGVFAAYISARGRHFFANWAVVSSRSQTSSRHASFLRTFKSACNSFEWRTLEYAL